jgi:hypothetical protein
VGFSDFTHALCGKGIRVWLWLKAKGQELRAEILLFAKFSKNLCQGRLGGSTKLESLPAWDTTKMNYIVFYSLLSREICERLESIRAAQITFP